jgi:hypothetical protein
MHKQWERSPLVDEGTCICIFLGLLWHPVCIDEHTNFFSCLGSGWWHGQEEVLGFESRLVTVPMGVMVMVMYHVL